MSEWGLARGRLRASARTMRGAPDSSALHTMETCRVAISTASRPCTASVTYSTRPSGANAPLSGRPPRKRTRATDESGSMRESQPACSYTNSDPFACTVTVSGPTTCPAPSFCAARSRLLGAGIAPVPSTYPGLTGTIT